MKKHAYLVLAHNNLETFESLIASLDDERNDIYVHVDLKADIKRFLKVKNKIKKSNVYFVKNRVSITWGSYEMVQAELELLMISSNTAMYQYYHLLSGVDMPLKSQDYINSFFDRYNGLEFIQFWEKDEINKSKYINRYKYYNDYSIRNRTTSGKLRYHFLRNLSLVMQKIRKVNRLSNIDYEISMGSQWFSITNDFANYILRSRNEIEKTYKKTLVPDESFVQTLFLQSPYKGNLFTKTPSSGFDSNMRLIKFEHGNPKIWLESDFDEIRKSCCLFGRKFDNTIDSDIILKIQELINKGDEEDFKCV